MLNIFKNGLFIDSILNLISSSSHQLFTSLPSHLAPNNSSQINIQSSSTHTTTPKSTVAATQLLSPKSLYDTAKVGDLRKGLELLDNGVEIDVPSEDGIISLYLAAPNN